MIMVFDRVCKNNQVAGDLIVRTAPQLYHNCQCTLPALPRSRVLEHTFIIKFTLFRSSCHLVHILITTALLCREARYLLSAKLYPKTAYCYQ